MSNKIVFTYDIVCPYAYIASHQIEQVAKRCNAALEWVPVLLGGIYKLDKASQGAAGSASDVMSVPKKRNMAIDLYRQAARYKATLNMPDLHPMRSINAMRILSVTQPQSKRIELSRLLYSAYWIDNADITQNAVLNKICNSVGVDASVMNSQQAKQQLLDNTQQAFDKGSFGVPTMFCTKANGDTDQYFGGDRLHLCEQFFNVPNATEYRAVPNKSLSTKPTVEFIFDFSSPWTYLAYTQLHQLRQHCNVKVIPVLLGAIFRETGGPMLPMNAMSENKRAYFRKDMQDTVNWHNVQHFQFNTHFPIRSVTALRIAIIEPKTIDCLFAAAWQHDVDFGDANAVKQTLSKAGFDAEQLFQQANTDSIKKQLIDNTNYALTQNVFGCPTYLYKDQLFFGGDRVPALLDVIYGFDVSLPISHDKWPLKQSDSPISDNSKL